MDEITSNKSDKNSNDDSSLKRIGNFIKDARLSRNQSIEELASALKIGVHQLRAIEEGNEELLPEKIFIKAMVRRISEKLKVDTAFIMGEFNTERKEVKIEELVQEVSNKAKNERKSKKHKSITSGLFVIISGILGLLASSLIFSILTDTFQNQIPKHILIKKN